MKKRLLFCWAGSLALFLAPFSAASQDALKEQGVDDIFELSLEELLNLTVVSASKFEQKQSEAPNIISAVPREVSRSFGWLSANEVLNYQPGFFPSHDFERRTVGFRGMFEGWNNNHLLMMVDGIPFNDNLYGTAFTWEITPLNFVNSIEVIRGPGGALYGTNAMNGVVTLNTLNASDLQGAGNVRFRYGTNGYKYLDVITGAENDYAGFVMSFNHNGTYGNEYESYDASERVDGLNNPLKFSTRDARESNYFFSKFYGKGKLKGIMLQYHEHSWNFETGHGWLFSIPDRPEEMSEYRRIVALKYSPEFADSPFGLEFTSRYQVHGVNWNMRYYNDGAYAGYYPDGVSEMLKTKAHDVFTRLQGSYKIGDNLFIVGAENTTFIYNDDEIHYANIDMNTWTDPDGITTHFNLNPWLDFISGHNVHNIAGYAQYISPKFLNKIQITASGRFDRMFFDYNDLNTASSPVKSKSFQMFTPRVALVFIASEKLTVKGIFGQAFRTPSPTEMFGSNTYSLASNIEELKPEIVTNVDLGLIWDPSSNITLRANGFWIDFRNQISYSVANNNLSTNIYSLKTAGAELEARYMTKTLSAFGNLTYAKRLGEDILDNTITESDDVITWAPAITFKAGGSYSSKWFAVSALGYYQGEMKRRESDKFIGMETYRPIESVKGWVSADLKASFKITPKAEFALIGKNILNAERYFIKNNQYMFDYKLEGRQIIAEVQVRF
jgi:iron complex outermembrane receptor protein